MEDIEIVASWTRENIFFKVVSHDSMCIAIRDSKQVKVGNMNKIRKNRF